MKNKYLIFLLLISVLGYFVYTSSADDDKINYTKTVREAQENTQKLEKINHLYYITGAVAEPGLYQINNDISVGEFIKIAGGLLPYADVAGLNMASNVESGMHIHVPFNFNGDPAELLRKNKININTSTEDDLKQIKGVGPSTAKKIIEYRTANGPFKSIEDLKKVKGIGNATFEKFKGSITI